MLKLFCVSTAASAKQRVSRTFSEFVYINSVKITLALFAWRIPAAVVIYGSIFRSAMRILLEDKNQIEHIFRLK